MSETPPKVIDFSFSKEGIIPVAPVTEEKKITTEEKTSPGQVIQDLIRRGYSERKTFSPKQGEELERYIDGLRANGVECKFVIDEEGKTRVFVK